MNKNTLIEKGTLMKYTTFMIFTMSLLTAQETQEVTIHPSSMYLIFLFLFLAIVIGYAYFINKCNQQKNMLDIKDEKITALEEEKRENKTALLLKEQEKEKEMLLLQHTIADLERQIQEGTKNQVVAKIEALEKKRQNGTQS